MPRGGQRAAPGILGKGLEEVLASLCVDSPLEGGGEPWVGNVGLHRDSRKAPDPSSQCGPDTGEGLSEMLMGLGGGGKMREAGVMLGVGSKGPF